MSEHLLQHTNGKGWYWLIAETDDHGNLVRHEGSAPTRGAARTGLEEFKIKREAERHRIKEIERRAQRLAEAEAQKQHGDYRTRREKVAAFEAQIEAAFEATREKALARHRKALGLPPKAS